MRTAWLSSKMMMLKHLSKVNGAAVVQNDLNGFLVVMQFHGAGALVELSVNSE